MKNYLLVGIFGLIIGLTFGILFFGIFLNEEEKETSHFSYESGQSSEQLEEKEAFISSEETKSVEGLTTNQQEHDAISETCSTFISLFYLNHLDVSNSEKMEQLKPFLSEKGKEGLLKDYEYQEGTDVANTQAVRATNYITFDSVTGQATVMSFMIFQTSYPEQSVMNAQTIVQIQLTKNEEDYWQIDYAEMRLLNQTMPESFFS